MNNTPTVAPYLTGIAAKLQDPVVVHAAMLRGEIAKPAIRDMLHLYGADALARWDAAPPPAEPMARFCPGCGSVGQVPDTYRDCCPDGIKARVIPAALAESCHGLFQLAIGAAHEVSP